ncbi:MAG: DMT family transporter [Brachymonas sp.]|nr:DMT family transporter [Brachymonas sp.]
MTLPRTSTKDPAKGVAFALCAIALWGSLATLGVSLRHVPPFLLTGLGLLAGSVVALPLSRGRFADWRVPLPTLLLGIAGLFGYHVLLFAALRLAPPVQANLLNYLWPLGMVLLAPVWLRGVRLRWQHVAAALVGFAGAALALSDGAKGGASLQAQADSSAWLGYALAVGAAFTWSSYSLLTQRVAPFKTAAIGTFCLVSGVLALFCHAVFEVTPALSLRDGVLIAVLGLGPLGGAFFLWDAALKRADARTIGLLAFITPLLSTTLLLLSRGEPLTGTLVVATALIVGAALVGARAR